METQYIKTLQLMLRAIAAATGEIPSVVPDGIFGPQTEAAVRSFQAAAELPVTGRVDDRTWQDIIIAYDRLIPFVEEAAPIRVLLRKNEVLERGSRNSHVHLVQAMLKVLGNSFSALPRVSVSGVYDAATESAVRAFQQFSQLPPNGKVDFPTWNALTETYRLVSGDGNL